MDYAMNPERIRRFLADRFLFDENAAIDCEQSLIASGVLDSTGAMELVLFLETEFHIEVEPHELVPLNLDSITRIAAFVQRKCEAAPARPSAHAASSPPRPPTATHPVKPSSHHPTKAIGSPAEGARVSDQ